jgi:hypothetical protein
MSEEWIEVGKQKPKEGQLVDILIGSNTVMKLNVRFEAGRFWQYRTGPDAGLAYDPDSWRPAQDKPVRATLKDGAA